MAKFKNIEVGSLKIETWYDRSIRSWTTQLKDAEGNQIGNASHDAIHDDVRASREQKHREAHKILKAAEDVGPDFEVSGGGTVYLFTPLTEAAREWVDENIPDDAQRLGNGIAVEHRYIAAIVEGAQGDGLTVA